MNLHINITSNNHCKLTIQDRTEYLPESSLSVVKGDFKYSDTVSIVVLQNNKISETTVLQPSFDYHSSTLIEVPISFDGWFTINYLVLPNKSWFDRELAKTSGSAINLYNIVYYVDNNTIYKYQSGTTSLVDVEEILEVNTVNTTISKSTSDYVSICYLQKCYINLCLQIFNSKGLSSCWNKNDVDSELVYKRDLVWMAINVIKYLTEFHSSDTPTLSEVLRIIEQITSCNGLCTSDSTLYSSSSECGCSK